MPAIVNYDVRISAWEWCIANSKVVGGKLKINRKPQFNFDLAKVKESEYFNRFFEESKKKKSAEA